MNDSQPKDTDEAYASLLSSLFALLERYDSHLLYSFRSRKPGFGPEFVRLVNALAEFRATFVEGKPVSAKGPAPSSEMAPISAEETALIEDLFNNKILFPTNEELRHFLFRTLNIQTNEKYSRKMVVARALRALSAMNGAERQSFLVLLREARNRAVHTSVGDESFFRQWTRVIKGDG